MLSTLQSVLAAVQADLEKIRGLLLQQKGAIVNVTADEKGLSIAEGHIRDFLQSLPESSAANADWSNSLPLLNEAITVPTQVCQSAVLFLMYRTLTILRPHQT